MAGYIIANIACNSPERLAAYSRLIRQSLTKYGGRALLRGQGAEMVENDWGLARLIVIEFPTVQRAKLWYKSHSYRSALQILQTHGGTNDLLIVEGRSPDFFSPAVASPAKHPIGEAYPECADESIRVGP
jgi:uncharacterized protein (DUF1330 family)